MSINQHLARTFIAREAEQQRKGKARDFVVECAT